MERYELKPFLPVSQEVGRDTIQFDLPYPAIRRLDQCGVQLRLVYRSWIEQGDLFRPEEIQIRLICKDYRYTPRLVEVSSSRQLKLLVGFMVDIQLELPSIVDLRQQAATLEISVPQLPQELDLRWTRIWLEIPPERLIRPSLYQLLAFRAMILSAKLIYGNTGQGSLLAAAEWLGGLGVSWEEVFTDEPRR